MKNESSGEKELSKKSKGRKRGARIDDSEQEEENNERNNYELEEDKITPKKDKRLELQKKLKFIVNEVREKGKYEYNKQIIPENLKYHSDESDSSISRTTNNKNNKDKSNSKNICYTNSNKYELSDKVSDKQSVRTKKTTKNKEINIMSSISSKKRIKNNTSNKKNEIAITDFSLENNSKQIKNEKFNENSDNKKINNKNNSIEKSEGKEEENSSNYNDRKKSLNEENKSKKNLKLKHLLENKNDILKREKEKKDSSYKKKSSEENITDNNNNNPKEFSEKESENLSQKKKTKNNVREIIERLRAKKNEKEDLARMEKEAEEQSLMRYNIKKENKEPEDKIDEEEVEKEAEKIRKKEKRMEERRLAREQRRKKEEEDKKRKEKEFEERKQKEKLKELENNQDENVAYKKNSNKLSGGKYENKLYLKRKISKERENKNKKIEQNLQKEFDKNEIKENKKEINNKQSNANSTLKEKNYDSKNTYKKPVQKNFDNGKNKVYCPKKLGGAMRGRSHEKVRQNDILNNLGKNKNYLNDNSSLIFSSMKNKKLNGNNFINSPSVAYSKKRTIGGLVGDKLLQLNKSFGELRANSGLENGNNNNLMNGMYNINTLELSSLPDLNSSFDSRVFNYNNNTNFQLLNNEFYTRTAQKNYHNNTINSGNLNTSNRFSNLNNLLTPSNIGNYPNLNGLNYIGGENQNLFNVNNNSLLSVNQNRINPYDLNSSYNLGYNNPLANYQNNKINVSEVLNNNFLALNNNAQNIPTNLINYNLGVGNLQNIFMKKNSSINIDDLLVLDEKFNEIVQELDKTNKMMNECFDFWNYYFNCSLYGSLEKLFTNVMDSNNVQISINYILMSILICYDCSFDSEVLNTVFPVLKDLLNLNHKNLMLIYEHILSKISTESKDNIWVLKLLNIVNSSKNSDLNDYNTLNDYSMTLIEKINFNTGIIIQNIRVLLKNYKMPRVEYLTSLFKKINDKSYEDINNFFRQYIIRVDNVNGSILASILLRDNSEFKSVPPPYLHTHNQKQYSLILELDETLVYFKVNQENENEGVLKVRPGVMEFLEEVDKYYELIIFTCSTQDYANLLIEAIEENKIYFEHRLYRQHTVIIDNDFVKDLTRIGRPLDKIVIVDNMPQNFRLQKENGVNIKPFWGEDIYDAALINLTPILINIAEEGGDIRQGLAKYRDEIVEKVTSNIYKHNI